MGDVVMPRLSDSMEEGTIVKWLVADGRRGRARRGDRRDRDRQGDDDLRGRLGRGHLAGRRRRGTRCRSGAVIARDRAAGWPRNPASTGRAVEAEEAPVRSDKRRLPPPGPPPLPSRPTPSPRAEAPAAPAPARGPQRPLRMARIGSRHRRWLGGMARERGVDIGSLSGTGPGGRIVKADVEAAAGRRRLGRFRESGAPSVRSVDAGPSAPAEAPAPARRRARSTVEELIADAAGRSRGGWPSRGRPCPTSRCRPTSTWSGGRRAARRVKAAAGEDDLVAVAQRPRREGLRAGAARVPAGERGLQATGASSSTSA